MDMATARLMIRAAIVAALLFTIAGCTRPSGAAQSRDAAASPSADVSPQVTDEPASLVPQASSPIDQLPEELADALRDASWALWLGDGWVVGDLAGVSSPIDVSRRATINDYSGTGVTAVDPQDDTWRILDISTDGTVEEIATLPAAQSMVDATQSRDGRRVFLHSSEDGVDGGVTVIDLDTGAASHPVQAGEKTPGEDRIQLFWSSTGRNLFSLRCGMRECAVDMIDGDTGIARRLAKPFGPVAASDQYAVGYSAAEVGEPRRPWEVYDLGSDNVREIAKEWITLTNQAVSLGEDRFALDGWGDDRKAYNVVVYDAATGEARLVWSQDPDDGEVKRILRIVSGTPWVVLSREGLAAEAPRGARLDVLDTRDGTLIEGAAVVSP